MVIAEKKSQRSTPRWKRRPDARPSEIADAALEVFAKSGFESATMDEIAMKAGVSKGTIYLYYPSKEDLLVASVENKIERNQAQVLPLLSGATGLTDEKLTVKRAGEILTNALDGILTLITSKDSITMHRVIMAERHHSKKLKEKHIERANIAISTITGFLKYAHDQNVIDCPFPKVTARIIMSLIISYAASDEIIGSGKGRFHSEQSRKVIIDLLLRGLGLYTGGKQKK